ncbi:DUF3618 domain-containing protein [Georgenia alba]|uniref:DUF3618 domain-containing protein n=1 Tax=Georgenia alba TaxID=2233858 RepID=A0ABW2QF24_9MICO
MTQPSAENGQPNKPSIAELEARIAKMRLDVTTTVDELSDRIDPRRQIENAKAQVKDMLSAAGDRAQAFRKDVASGDPKSLGILAVGVAAVGLVITVKILRR